MKKFNIFTYIAFAFSVVSLLSGVPNAKAEELNARLSGTYAFNKTITCTPGGTFQMQGILTFDGNGNGELLDGIALKGGGLLGLSGVFTYTVESDNYFTMTSNDVSVDNGVTISGIVQDGWIGRGGQTLIISDTDNNDETLKIGTNVILTRTCGRAGTAVKVSKD